MWDRFLRDRRRGDAELGTLDDADLVDDGGIVVRLGRGSNVDVANLILDFVVVVVVSFAGWFGRGGGGGGVREHLRRGVRLFPAEDRLGGGVKLREDDVGVEVGVDGGNHPVFLFVRLVLLRERLLHGRR